MLFRSGGKSFIKKEVCSRIFLHSLQIVPYPEPSEEALSFSRKKYESYFHKSWSLYLLLSTYGFLLLLIVIGVRHKISAFFLLCFLLPAAALIIFLASVGGVILKDLENSKVYELKRSMSDQFQRILKIQDSAEQRFQNSLAEINQEILEFIGRKVNNATTHQSDSPIKDNSFNREFIKLLEKKKVATGMGIILTNGENSFFPYKKKRDGWRSKARSSYLQILHGLIWKKNPEDGKPREFRAAYDTLLQIRRLFLGGDNIQDDFLNNPARLYQIDINIRPFPWLETKNFWFYLVEPETEDVWMGLGELEGNKLLMDLKEEFERNSNQDTLLNFMDDFPDISLEYFVSDVDSPKFFPEQKIKKGYFHLISQKARYTQKNQFLATLEEDGKCFFYMAGPFLKNQQIVLSIRVSADSVFKNYRDLLNDIYFSAWLLLILLAGICIPLSYSVTKPIMAISAGLNRIRNGDLTLNIVSRGFDQFATAANQFNSLIEQLREKERLSKFLSQIAMRSIASGEKNATRQRVGVFFCGITNISDDKQNSFENRFERIQFFLDLLSECLEESNGKMDKFTGQAAIVLFSGENSAEEMTHLAVLMRQRLSKRPSVNLDLKIGVGLAIGDVVLGSVGPSMRKDYTAIGSTVNLAARLHEFTARDKDFAIILNQELKDILGESDYLYEALGRLTIRGLKDQQEIYELI